MKIIQHIVHSVPAFGVDAAHVVILTQDDCGLVACYEGIIPRKISDDHLNRIAGSGRKLNYDNARKLFDILEKDYRK